MKQKQWMDLSLWSHKKYLWIISFLKNIFSWKYPIDIILLRILSLFYNVIFITYEFLYSKLTWCKLKINRQFWGKKDWGCQDKNVSFNFY